MCGTRPPSPKGTIDVLQLEQLLRRIGQPVRRIPAGAMGVQGGPWGFMGVRWLMIDGCFPNLGTHAWNCSHMFSFVASFKSHGKSSARLGNARSTTVGTSHPQVMDVVGCCWPPASTLPRLRRFVLKELVQEVNDDNEGRVDLSSLKKQHHSCCRR